jgi:hypothetical protein
VFEPAPQKLVNIRYAGTNPLETDRVISAIARAEAEMGEKGRLVVRKSGTEPLIRVMAEALEEGHDERGAGRCCGGCRGRSLISVGATISAGDCPPGMSPPFVGERIASLT